MRTLLFQLFFTYQTFLNNKKKESNKVSWCQIELYSHSKTTSPSTCRRFFSYAFELNSSLFSSYFHVPTILRSDIEITILSPSSPCKFHILPQFISMLQFSKFVQNSLQIQLGAWNSAWRNFVSDNKFGWFAECQKWSTIEWQIV